MPCVFVQIISDCIKGKQWNVMQSVEPITGLYDDPFIKKRYCESFI